MKRFACFGFSALGKFGMAALAAAVLAVAAAPRAQAAYIFNFNQVGANVVATGSGSLNWDSLTFTSFTGPLSIGVDPLTGFLGVGNLDGSGAATVGGDNFSTVSGPTSFGTGGFTAASSTSGTVAGIEGSINEVIIPGNYPFAHPPLVPSTTTWNNTTIAGLGLTPGSYVWTWGSVDARDSLTINIPSAVPLNPSPWMNVLLTFAGIGFMAYRRKSKPTLMAA
jgi:hypothetical protein